MRTVQAETPSGQSLNDVDKTDGRTQIVKSPHELEFLRQAQAHRRLGFSHAQREQWIAAAGLKLSAVEDLSSAGAQGGLTVSDRSPMQRSARSTAKRTLSPASGNQKPGS